MGCAHRISLVALTLAACGDSAQEFVLAWPGAAGESYVLAVYDEAQIEIGAGVWPPSSRFVRDEWLADGELAVELLIYEDPLNALGLESGPLDVVVGPGKKLPTPRATFSASSDRVGFRSELGMSVRLEAISLRTESSHCRSYAAQEIELLTTRGFAHTAQLDATRVIYGVSEGEIFIVDEVGHVELTRSSSSVFIRSTASDRDGRFLIGDHDGHVWTATVEGTHVDFGILGKFGAGGIYQIDGETSENAADVFVLDVDGRLGRITEATTSTLATFPEAAFPTGGGLVRIGPAEALLATVGRDTVAHYRNGEIEMLPIPGGDLGVSTLERAGGEIYALGSEGRVYQYVEGSFKVISSTGVLFPQHAVAQFQDRLIFSAGEGLLIEAVDGFDVCPPIGVTMQRFIELHPLQDRAMFARLPKANGMEPVRYAIITPL